MLSLTALPLIGCNCSDIDLYIQTCKQPCISGLHPLHAAIWQSKAACRQQSAEYRSIDLSLHPAWLAPIQFSITSLICTHCHSLTCLLALAALPPVAEPQAIHNANASQQKHYMSAYKADLPIVCLGTPAAHCGCDVIGSWHRPSCRCCGPAVPGTCQPSSRHWWHAA